MDALTTIIMTPLVRALIAALAGFGVRRLGHTDLEYRNGKLIKE